MDSTADHGDDHAVRGPGSPEAAAEVTEEAASGSKNIAEFVFGSGMVKWFKDGGWAMWPICW
jgi:hypothetical protein